jgi:hypothetical protein
MRARNHVVYGDAETLARLKAEYDYLGRPTELFEDRLVVFAIAPKPQKKGAKRGARRSR